MKATNFWLIGLIAVLLGACEYEHLERRLEVIHGEGSGLYLYGEAVTIEAFPAEPGMQFSGWIGDTTGLQGLQGPNATFIMPHRNLRLEATYREVPNLVSYRSAIRPIIKRSCAKSTCHDANSIIFPLTTYTEVKGRAASIRSVVLSGRMPLDTALPENEVEAIDLWVQQGALEN